MEYNIDKSKYIDEFAKSINVKRWGTTKTLNDFTLISHNARVVNICFQMFNMLGNFNVAGVSAILKCNTIEYALYHDYGEIYLNDMPSDIKEMFPELDHELKLAEATLAKGIFNLDNMPTSDQYIIKCIVKLADWLDCMYECVQEINLGNKNPKFKDTLNKYNNTFAIVKDKYGSLRNAYTWPQHIDLVEAFIQIAQSMANHLIENMYD